MTGGSLYGGLERRLWREKVDERNQSNGQGDGGLFIGLRIVCRTL